MNNIEQSMFDMFDVHNIIVSLFDRFCEVYWIANMDVQPVCRYTYRARDSLIWIDLILKAISVI